MERADRILRRDPGPDSVDAAAPLEAADAVEPEVEAGVRHRAERSRDILGDMAIDLADEAQGQVELIVVLPASTRDIAHSRNEYLAHRTGGTKGDKQSMHGQVSLSETVTQACSASFKA